MDRLSHRPVCDTHWVSLHLLPQIKENYALLSSFYFAISVEFSCDVITFGQKRNKHIHKPWINSVCRPVP